MGIGIDLQSNQQTHVALNHTTPKLLCQGRNGVDPKFLFGLDSQLFLHDDHPKQVHHSEVETVTVIRASPSHIHTHADCQHTETSSSDTPLTLSVLEDALSHLNKEIIWRVKGFVRVDQKIKILNWAFGRTEFTNVEDASLLSSNLSLRLTCMGEPGDLKRGTRQFLTALDAQIS